MSQTLINALQQAKCYPHPVEGFDLRETHISWIVMTGRYAYKIKKPLDFGFLDFSTLEKRRHCCDEEIRLNARLAGDLYQSVVPITGSPEAPVIGGLGEPFEYAVCMEQFDDEGLFSTLQATGQLTQTMMDDLVDQLVAFHARAERAGADSEFGTPEAVIHPAQENFDQLKPLLSDADDLKRLSELEAWTQNLFERFTPLFKQRHDQGFIRNNHGDIHLANAVMHEGHALIFDCIEFNDHFRWNDVCCELAFLLMDLEARGEQELANRALDRYLERSGDFELVKLLPFYKAYRAMVRAKVAMFRYQQPDLHPVDRDAVLADFRRYLTLAERYSEFSMPYMLIAVGVSGSGKSRFTEQAVRQLGGIRVRSDVERKRLHGIDPFAPAKSHELGRGLYSPEATRSTYDRLSALSGMLLQAGHSVCVDGTCLSHAQREQLRFEAESRGLPMLLISFEADEATLKRRITKRSQRRDSVSDAGLDVLEHQLRSFEPFTPDEQAHLVHLDTTAEDANLTLVALIKEHLQLA
ncbi:AAA family ATPase [Larsenimonas salina]|uniref:bifunctional aminoglycoside phosphotransferase/ATP-binding protein n=1 Tax=Larsenimonas salina TaxID=1295565 RepID=UPI00207442D3|nr:bifunctional aminoglycoside phosphotransferase/ATP-binding protein [Larsenimonas salina]MCM5704691.1 AAA family ATPase [Larsenimonas salina]